jgi:hypothetical protein
MVLVGYREVKPKFNHSLNLVQDLTLQVQVMGDPAHGYSDASPEINGMSWQISY